MKKLLVSVLFIFSITILFTACNSNDNDSFDGSEWAKDLRESQKIEVINAENKDTISEITDTTGIETFTNSLDIDSWEIATLPENAKKQMTFILYNTETVKLGQDENDVSLIEVGRIITYNNYAYITFKTDLISFDFKISDNTAEYLNSYAK